MYENPEGLRPPCTPLPTLMLVYLCSTCAKPLKIVVHKARTKVPLTELNRKNFNLVHGKPFAMLRKSWMA